MQEQIKHPETQTPNLGTICVKANPFPDTVYRCKDAPEGDIMEKIEEFLDALYEVPPEQVYKETLEEYMYHTTPEQRELIAPICDIEDECDVDAIIEAREEMTGGVTPRLSLSIDFVRKTIYVWGVEMILSLDELCALRAVLHDRGWNIDFGYDVYPLTEGEKSAR